ncbi:MAG TPA: aminotransferase class I/II-fold pyridoxal phosphate-dependent enzyme [Burkholderiales bacterium]|nr:aminotransferase class I/II-fold pyridoxal phosphate-dependent enzyme [Burkholderiales bacterium]
MLNYINLSQRLIDADYAVRGRIVIRAQELEKQGKKITYCNIGNPHAFAQKPMTYVREVLSLLEFPNLLKQDITSLFHSDSIERAKSILKALPEGVGAYSASAGVEFARVAVAEFISKRDNIPADSERIILTDGASKAAQSVITAIIKNPTDGLMLPVPQYPMYSATLTLVGGQSIGYYLDEANHWQLNEESLLDSYNTAKMNKLNPVAITVINPGNPTGAVLSYDNIKMIINFARKHNLSILADEVYQENIYSKTAKFHSFAKVMHEMQVTDVTLFSFHSMSKGYYGECGHRSGYLEVRNVPDDVFAQFVKLQSINLCANLAGQIACYLMVSPPEPGDASYDLYLEEKTFILNDLKEKAQIIGSELNNIDGLSVNIPEGAMYAFVKIELPAAHINRNAESAIDEKYCMALLEDTGICVVPGSGFGQFPNTLHFRTTFLPPREQIIQLVEQLRVFHKKYLQQL